MAHRRAQPRFAGTSLRSNKPTRLLAATPASRCVHRRQARERSDYRRYYTDETARLVAEHFAADIARFGYAFDDPAALVGAEPPA